MTDIKDVSWVVGYYEEILSKQTIWEVYEDRDDMNVQIADYLDEESAHLVAAAPDLYHALNELLENLKKNNNQGAGIRPITLAKNALAKARGENDNENN